MLTKQQDAFGQQLFDYYHLQPGTRERAGIIERSDGYIDDSGSMRVYFGGHKDWYPIEKKAIRFARGSVLDAGPGAGRHALHLQEKGLAVTCLDNSPLALQVCLERGVKTVISKPLEDIDPDLGIFDTVLMLGNNFGLFGSERKMKVLLKKLDRITSPKARIIATTNDVTRTDNPDHLAYQAENRRKGRMSGQIKMRCRYRKLVTPWFDYLMVSKQEMEYLLEGTGWFVLKYIDSETSQYAVIIEKKKHGATR